jgi:hypothetical protein
MANNFESLPAKPANDAYTGMLAISLIALLIGSAVLYLDYSQYPGTPPPKPDYSFKDRSVPDQIERQREVKAPPPDENPGGDQDNPKEPPPKKDG